MARSTPVFSLLLTALAAAQEPARLDVVEMKSGERLQGQVVAQADGMIEIRLGDGAVIGIGSDQVSAIHRGAGTPPAPVAQKLAAREEWFVLHDGKGEPVGWMQSVTSTEGTGVRLAEEWEFVLGARTVGITIVEQLDSALQPRTSYWRERIRSEGAAAVVEERILSTEFGPEGLEVRRTTPAGNSSFRLPAASSLQFPLGAMARLRAGLLAKDGNPVELAVFDPQLEEVVVRRYEPARRRTVNRDGSTQPVFEVAQLVRSIRNTEWLDAEGNVLRREVSGPALVAVRSDKASARLVVRSQLKYPPSLVRERNGAFGLWLPNPSWVAAEEVPAGQLALHCEGRGLGLGVALLDHLPADTSLDAATDAVVRWLALMQPGVRVVERGPTRIRDRDAMRLVLRGRAGRSTLEGAAYVVPCGTTHLVASSIGTSEQWNELAADVAAMVQGLELAPAALSPVLQGPLAEKPPAKPVQVRVVDLTGEQPPATPPKQ